MSGNFTFDVQVMSENAQWTSTARLRDEADARREAQKLVSMKKFLGVKVIKEQYDFIENRFMEKTIFKQLRHDQGSASFYDRHVGKDGIGSHEPADYAGYGDYEDYDDYDRGSRTILIAGTALALIAVLMGLGLFLFAGPGNEDARSRGNFYVYDLPPVVTNIHARDKTYQVKMNIQLELDDYSDADEVELVLSKVMHSVVENIQQTDAADLNKREKIQVLRKRLELEIQKAMGETRLNGVLFNSIQVH